MAIGLPARHDRGSLNCRPDIVEADSITSVAFDGAVLVGMVGEIELSTLVGVEDRSHCLHRVKSIISYPTECFGYGAGVLQFVSPQAIRAIFKDMSWRERQRVQAKPDQD